MWASQSPLPHETDTNQMEVDNHIGNYRSIHYKIPFPWQSLPGTSGCSTLVGTQKEELSVMKTTATTTKKSLNADTVVKYLNCREMSVADVVDEKFGMRKK